MRDLVNVGGVGEHIFVDSDLVIIVLPNTEKKFGSLVVCSAVNMPIGTNLAPEDVVDRLAGKA